MSAPIWDNSPQGSSGWLKSRIGVLTASRMADALAFKKNGEESEARRQLKYDLLAERMTDFAVETYVTKAMQHGIEQEPNARERYEEETGNIVQLCGLALHGGIEYFGASPDGLVGVDGLIEIKCPSSTKYMRWYVDGVVPDEHKPQMLAQMAVTGRTWCDFVAYDPRFPYAAQIFIRRYEPTREEILAVEEGARQFLSEMDVMWEQLIGA